MWIIKDKHTKEILYKGSKKDCEKEGLRLERFYNRKVEIQQEKVVKK